MSDLYQDLFGEGSFIGKGIYDVDAFEQILRRTSPRTPILSHDLLESAYARSALLSDVELYEEFPSRYPADVSRRHRWIRGDWQIAWWLLPWVPAGSRYALGKRTRSPHLSWWKIFDNLRRSLVPVAMLALLLISWLLAGRRWDGGDPLRAGGDRDRSSAGGAGRPGSASRRPAAADAPARDGRSRWANKLAQFLFTLIFLPYEAYISVDAIVRTTVRMFWTKRKLLEWKTSSDADAQGSRRSAWLLPVDVVRAGDFRHGDLAPDPVPTRPAACRRAAARLCGSSRRSSPGG